MNFAIREPLNKSSRSPMTCSEVPYLIDFESRPYLKGAIQKETSSC